MIPLKDCTPIFSVALVVNLDVLGLHQSCGNCDLLLPWLGPCRHCGGSHAEKFSRYHLPSRAANVATVLTHLLKPGAAGIEAVFLDIAGFW